MQNLLNFLLPRTCALCHESSHNQMICDFCQVCLPWQKNYCPRCATPMEHNNVCGRCIKKPPYFDHIIVPFCYEAPLQHLIVQLKFHQKIYYANALSAAMLPTLKYFYADKTMPEWILPVPLSKERMKIRGYNQALEIAKPIAKKMAIALNNQALIKIRHTMPQTALDFTSRAHNIKNSFAWSAKAQVQHVAIIDDVITTGSTVNEIAKLLKQQGLKQVDVWGIARTVV